MYQQPLSESNGLNTNKYTYGSYGQVIGTTTLQKTGVELGTESTLSYDGKQVENTKTYIKSAGTTYKNYKHLKSYTYNVYGAVRESF